MGAMPTFPMQPATGDNNNNMMNNPFMYLIFLLIFARNGGGLFGGGENAAGAVTASQVDDIRAQVASIKQGVECGNATTMNELNQLAAQARLNGMAVNTSTSEILRGICGLEHQLQTQGASFINQMNQCCCDLKGRMDAGFCNVDKGILNQTISLNQSLNGINSQLLAQTNGINQGFAAQSYISEKQTCDIKQAIADQSQLIRDLHTQDQVAALNAINQNLRDELSSSKNLAIATAVANTASDRVIRTICSGCCPGVTVTPPTA